MAIMKFGADWLNKIMPDGMIYPSSTLISGPGGSGKPLIGFIMAGEWLKQGRAVIFVLTSTTREYLEKSMELLGMPLKDHEGRYVFIETEPKTKGLKEVSADMWSANMVDPEMWDIAINKATEALGRDKKEIMIVGSALNLFFFSKTYREGIAKKLKDMIEDPGEYTLMFTVNSDAFKETVEELEAVADNLMFSRMQPPMKLYLKIERMKDVRFSNEEIWVPLEKSVLDSIRQEAEKGKKGLIPVIKAL